MATMLPHRHKLQLRPPERELTSFSNIHAPTRNFFTSSVRLLKKRACVEHRGAPQIAHHHDSHHNTRIRSYFRVVVDVFCISAVVILTGSHGSMAQDQQVAEMTGAPFGNGTAHSISPLPFLGEPTNGKAEMEGPLKPKWMHVISAKAAHPAMYVPGDGLVYCPIAKVRIRFNTLSSVAPWAMLAVCYFVAIGHRNVSSAR